MDTPIGTTVFAGVDEAGLGPILGPLTIGFSAFRAPSNGGDPVNLWKTLAPVVTRNLKRDAQAFVVADSKEVFKRTEKSAKRLEITALGFLTLLDEKRHPPTSAREILWESPACLAPTGESIAGLPWYDDPPTLPLWVDRGLLELRVEKLARKMRAQQVELLDAGVCVLPAGRLNRSFHETDNKAATHWNETRAVLRHLWERYAEGGMHLVVDRQGGRYHYGPHLARAFQDAEVLLEHEQPSRAEYRLTERHRGPRSMRVTFAEKADRRSFPVALASCLAKYAREVAMLGFNRYFESLQPNLKPTAGYRTDGWRWLEDAKPALERCGVEREVLVRER